MKRWMIFLLLGFIFTTFSYSLIGGQDERLEAVRRAINEKGAHWTPGITSLSNMSLDDARRQCGVLRFPRGPRIGMKDGVTPQMLRDSLDWRDHNGHNYTTPIRNQGGCGSCWAFGGLATLEAGIKILCDVPDTDVDLSEQYLLSCSGGSCNGWWMEPLFDFLQLNGVTDENCFPYEAVDTIPCSEKCTDWEYRTKTVKDWGLISESVDVIKSYLQDGPLAATMLVYVDFHNYYTGGVYEHVFGNPLGGHAISIVGWSDMDTCWICKNSWGTDWGEAGGSDSGGWFRIKMGQNECGIEEGAIWCQMEDLGTPSPPFDVTTLSLDHSVQLDWSDPCVDVYEFPITIDELRIYRDGKEAGDLICSVGAGVGNYTDEDVPNGEHLYYLQAINGSLSGHMVGVGGWSGPFAIEDGGVDREVGTNSTLFTFFALYHSPDNHLPDQNLIYLDSLPHQLSTLDYNYTDGSLFCFDTTLGCGIHDYHFLFSSQGDTIRYPEDGELGGPMVGWVAFSDDMEEGTDGWSHTNIRPGYRDEWHLTSNRNHTPDGGQSWWCGNEASGGYSNKVDAVLISPEVNLDSLSFLAFWHWIDVEIENDTVAWDGGIVEMSTDGGNHWSQITPIGGYPYRIEYNPASPFVWNTPCFSGFFDWSLAQFKIEGYNGPAQFRLHFGSDSYVTYEGWYIDDVIVYNISEMGVAESDSLSLLPRTCRLLQNYPNPFSTLTRINFYLPQKTFVNLSVYNILGQKVATLIDGMQSAGYKSVRWDARGMGNGFYFYRLKTPGYTASRNMILLR
ncbi:hypothetical protein CH333_06130 [candidate division WOR-3 bacterium JGI_Cruoil_03_44_89]|uniref:Peptidase C1A papain C-terminal domain-containing protein n=1 Tax=candidate division WOR-3 bacterium JGI_Cruoil_03_44_89 TaxID=1973748 RepID=A0A235BRV2_UNCW3|nr:MAG: hypothetical protein CH333_06130 [candidate division WOR-3 bacterium JGI_Cruoil_03_44_89]